MEKLTEVDLVVIDNDGLPLRFHSGDIVIYNDAMEAEEDCTCDGDRVVKAVDLDSDLVNELVDQINK